METATLERKDRILLVDDDETILKVFKDILIPNGYSVITAKNGNEAIAVAQSQQPGLILMDIMMPVTDGYTACSILKSDDKTKSIPLIMVTGINYELNKKLSERLNADGYIVKPVSIETLLDTVSKFIKN